MMQVLVSHSCVMCVQGQQLVVYGGESPHEADENEAGNVADAGNKVYNDLIILEPDMRLWIGLSITGISETLSNPTAQIPKRLLLFLRTADGFMNSVRGSSDLFRTCSATVKNEVSPLGGCSKIQNSHRGCIHNCP